jgi:hypothetical protein
MRDFMQQDGGAFDLVDGKPEERRVERDHSERKVGGGEAPLLLPDIGSHLALEC